MSAMSKEMRGEPIKSRLLYCWTQLIIPLFFIFIAQEFMKDNLLITYCYKYFDLAMEMCISKQYLLEAFCTT